MRKRLLLLCAGTFFLAGQIRAQWVVTDPGNLAQSLSLIHIYGSFPVRPSVCFLSDGVYPPVRHRPFSVPLSDSVFPHPRCV